MMTPKEKDEAILYLVQASAFINKAADILTKNDCYWAAAKTYGILAEIVKSLEDFKWLSTREPRSEFVEAAE